MQNLWERACSGRRSDDEAATFNIFVDCQAAIASKLAPTVFCGVGKVDGRYCAQGARRESFNPTR
ncbi:hypothetical protein D3C81_2261490 [compost metagenome]